jgi:FMN-dependent NADH-azoreductase
MKLLHIDSSILGDGSVSRGLTAAAADKLKSENPHLKATYRDLASEPLHHLSGAEFVARALPLEQRNPAQQHELEESDAALEEFLAADIVVIGAPMYNFSIPSQLKAWIDRIVVAGKTFRYSEKGPEGLAGGKKIVIVSSRGAVYSAGTPMEAIDFQEKYLSAIFGFLGISDIEFIRAEGIAFGPDHREKAITAAQEQIAA